MFGDPRPVGTSYPSIAAYPKFSLQHAYSEHDELAIVISLNVLNSLSLYIEYNNGFTKPRDGMLRECWKPFRFAMILAMIGVEHDVPST